MNAAKLFKKKIGSQWFLVLVLWNLPPSIRTKAEFLIPWGILPQGVESSDFPLYYQPFQGKHALLDLFVVHVSQISVASWLTKESWCSMATETSVSACGVSMSLLWRITQRAANVRTRATTGHGGSDLPRVRAHVNLRALRCFKCHIEKVGCRCGKTGYFVGAGSLLPTGHPLRVALHTGMYLGIYTRELITGSAAGQHLSLADPLRLKLRAIATAPPNKRSHEEMVRDGQVLRDELLVNAITATLRHPKQLWTTEWRSPTRITHSMSMEYTESHPKHGSDGLTCSKISCHRVPMST